MRQNARDLCCGLCKPAVGWGREKDGIGHLRVVQPIYVASDGTVLWNQTAISNTTLRSYIGRMSIMNPEPQAVLEVVRPHLATELRRFARL